MTEPGATMQEQNWTTMQETLEQAQTLAENGRNKQARRKLSKLSGMCDGAIDGL